MIRRRTVLAAGLLAGCTEAPALEGRWLGASAERGHRLRKPLPQRGDGPLRRARVLVVGGGIAGLACARTLVRAGVDDVAVLELEDEAGGNSRGHQLGGMACPLGAHYLPTPGPDAPEVYQLLEELGLVRQVLGRPVYDERHLCHSPQERLFFEGQWHEGLLPPAESAATREQYRRFSRAVDTARRELGFAMPTARARWTTGHARLDAQTFAAWLDAENLRDERLRWYLDYCCRDDYGAGSAEVSAWAGLHYFASRHGFHAPGDQGEASAERDAVLTWPEGNAFLARQMATDVGATRIHAGRTVLRVEESRQGVEVFAWNEVADSPERWTAAQVVMAVPLFIARRLLAAPPAALQAVQQAHAPWLVANLQLKAPLLDRLGAPPAWDNVSYGSPALGYVDAGHQRLNPSPGPTVLTAYWALPRSERGALLQGSWADWSGRVIAELEKTHPDLRQQLRRVDLMRWGHAMSIPLPGVRSSTALAALQAPQGRLLFAHADLSGYSVFEEAYTLGFKAAKAAASR